MLTAEQVATWLGAESIDILSGGEWSQAFGTADRVVRFGRHREDFLKDQLLAHYAGPRLPIPKVFEIGRAFDLDYCISERKFGRMIEDLTEAEMLRLVPGWLRLFEALRTCDVSEFSGFGMLNSSGDAPFSRWADFLLSVDEESERVSGWHDAIALIPGGMQTFSTSLAHMKSLVERCPEERCLIHSDLLHYNVLVDADEIVGVFDWGNAMVGDPLYELALFTFYSPWFDSMSLIDWAFETESHYQRGGQKLPNFRQRLLVYELHIGLGSLAYTAFSGRISDFDWTASRLCALLAI